MNKICFIKSKYKGDNSIKKTKRGFPIKKVLVRIAHVLIQIILLHGFDVCISLVKFNRYVCNTFVLRKTQ